MVTLQIDFVMYSQIHFINDFKILNYAIAEKYINKNNNESIFQYYEVIQFYYKDLITQAVFNWAL